MKQRRSILYKPHRARQQPRGSASSRKPANPKNIREAIPYLVLDGQAGPEKFLRPMRDSSALGDPKNFLGTNPTEPAPCRANANPKNIAGPIRPDRSSSVQYCRTRKISTDLNAARCDRLPQRDGSGIRRYANCGRTLNGTTCSGSPSARNTIRSGEPFPRNRAP